MTPQVPKFTDSLTAGTLVARLGNDFAVVKNPPYVFPPYDVYVLASPHVELADGMAAAVMDMDGTTTTTEVLCTGALESMVRLLCGIRDDGDNPVLDHGRDFPHIIGNSTTKHVEYLVSAYGDRFDRTAVCRSFIAACAWNISCALDGKRSKEAVAAMRVQGLEMVASHASFLQFCDKLKEQCHANAIPPEPLIGLAKKALRMETVADLTRIGVEVYYQRYHESLRRIAAGTFPIPHDGARPVAPMPGIGVALALLKGWLGKDAALFGDMLAKYLQDWEPAVVSAGLARLSALGAHFAAHPAKLGLVTSSIAAEAEIVLDEVFRVIREEISNWPLPKDRRDFLQERFAGPDRIYDARITASDSSEIRLKPHRDLYAIALHALGITQEQFHRVAGFEDSESGTIAIRAAGIPLCCALPFAMTRNHRFEAATQVCLGGMPEVMLLKNFFLPVS